MAQKNPYDQKRKFQFTNKIKGIQALHDHIIVVDMDFSGRQLASGILLLGDDGKADGIRPRWAKVYAVGPEQEHIRVGQYVMVSHGRWTRGIKIEDENGEKTIRRIDPNDILLISDEPVQDYTMGDKGL